MKKISFITCGRNDNYAGPDYLHRIYLSISTNIDLIKSHDIDFEYVLVDWNPSSSDNYLYKNQLIKNLFTLNEMRTVIVDRSVIIAEKLIPHEYHEYFAKNAGMRQCEGEYIIIVNSDIILTEEGASEIIHLINSTDLSNSFVRTRFRKQIHSFGNGEFEEIPNSCLDLYNTTSEYGDLIPGFSGDFLMVKRSTMLDKNCSYDETNIGHRGHLRQASMDGEILINMYKHGMSPIILQSPYYHINHGKPIVVDTVYNQDGYENKPNWGFIDYNITNDKNITHIYAKT